MQREGCWIVKAAVTIKYYADGVTTHLAHHGAASRSAETLQGVSCWQSKRCGALDPKLLYFGIRQFHMLVQGEYYLASRSHLNKYCSFSGLFLR